MPRNHLKFPFGARLVQCLRITSLMALRLALPVMLAGMLTGCSFLSPAPDGPAPDIPPASATSLPLPPSPTPIPTPVPTLPPQARIEEADRALFYGDYDDALHEYITALQTGPSAELEAAARLGIGRVQLLKGETNNALLSFRNLVETFPESVEAGNAWIFMAGILSSLERNEEAVAAYQAYMDRFPGILDAYVYDWQGDALRAAGQGKEAVRAYQAALDSPRLPGDETRIRIKIGGALADSGDWNAALELYTGLSGLPGNEAYEADLLLLRGELLVLLGRDEEAYALYAQAAAGHPQSPSAYIATLRLLDAGREVNELDRGLVDYYAGEYSLAVFALDRYLNAAPPEHDGSAHYFKGLALRAIDATGEAIAAWTDLVQTHSPADPYWDDAWEEIGDTQWAYLGDGDAAISTFESFAARVPDHPRAAEFLLFAGQIAEREGQLERAAAFFQRITVEYPASWLVSQAHFLAGITNYRLRNFETALANFQSIRTLTSEAFESSRAAFWAGKTRAALGDPAGAQLEFEQAAGIDPTGYYSERALDMTSGTVPFARPMAFDLAVDREAEQRFAEDWMRIQFSLPETIDFSYPGPLSGDIRFVRGTALWNLGFYELARAEFESLRLAMQSDPANNYRLANYLIDLGLYRTAIFCARQVLNLAGMDDAATLYAPPWFSHVRFGAYYRELVLPAAKEYGLHPLLIWSLMRQESLFEGFVRSPAGARGLMQIIPSTGQGIQKLLGWPVDYTAGDLYRPWVNVRFGVSYLSAQWTYFSGDQLPEPIHIYSALAAYNSGPGNAAAWLREAQDDMDLYLEIIRFDETRRYIRGVYELYRIYLGLYDRSP